MQEDLALFVEFMLRIFDAGVFLDKSSSPEGKGFAYKAHEGDPLLPLAPHYWMFRTADSPRPGPLTRELVSVIGRVLYNYALYLGLRFDHIVGIPHAAVAIAEAFANASPTPVSILRLEKQEIAGRRRIVGLSGNYRTGDRVLVIDDLVSQGRTKVEAISVTRESGLVVEDVLVLVDGELGGIDAIRRLGCQVHARFRLRQFLEVFVAHQRITDAARREILDYVATNRLR